MTSLASDLNPSNPLLCSRLDAPSLLWCWRHAATDLKVISDQVLLPRSTGLQFSQSGNLSAGDLLVAGSAAVGFRCHHQIHQRRPLITSCSGELADHGK